MFDWPEDVEILFDIERGQGSSFGNGCINAGDEDQVASWNFVRGDEVPTAKECSAD